MSVTGNAKRGQIECRYAEETRREGEHLDEVVAVNAHVHLEQMNNQSFALIIETDKQRACIMLGSKRAPVTAWVCWQEPNRKRQRKVGHVHSVAVAKHEAHR